MLFIQISCTQQPAPQYYQPAPIAVVQPGIQMGYQGSDYGAYITDSRGESYFLMYAMFNTLYSHGGYNSVTSYYYQHPNSGYFHTYQPGSFRASHTADAVAYNNRFNQSYQQAYQRHSVYTPSAAVVTKTVEIRQKTYGTGYKPSPTNVVITKPVTINTGKPTAPTPTSTVTQPPVRPVATTPATISRPVNLSKGPAPTTTATTRSVSVSTPVRSTPSYSSPSRSSLSTSFSSSRKH